MGEQINRLWYTHALENYLAIKKQTSDVITWMNLKSILVSERSQFQKIAYQMIPFIKFLKKENSKNYYDKEKISGCQV